jgi:hypothetical protein
MVRTRRSRRSETARHNVPLSRVFIALLKSNKKFRKELIAFSSLIRHGPHRKRLLHQFFVAVGTYSQSCYLTTIRGYTDPQTLLWYDADRTENDSWKQFFVTVGTYLQSCYLTTIRQTYRLSFDKTRIAQKTTRNNSSLAACIRCSEKVFTEPLRSNDRGSTHTDTQTNGMDLWNAPLGWTQAPWHTYQVS